jgi:hypothetical protein
MPDAVQLTVAGDSAQVADWEQHVQQGRPAVDQGKQKPEGYVAAHVDGLTQSLQSVVLQHELDLLQ